MKVKPLRDEIFTELVSIAMTPNGDGKPFVSSRLYSKEQLNDVKAKLMVLIDRLNSKESQMLFPDLYEEIEGCASDGEDPSEQEVQRPKIPVYRTAAMSIAAGK